MFRSNGLVFYYSASNSSKIGFMVSKNYGSSIERNLFKRSVRSIYLSSNKNKNLTLIVRPSKSKYNNKQLNDAFGEFFDRPNI